MCFQSIQGFSDSEQILIRLVEAIYIDWLGASIGIQDWADVPRFLDSLESKIVETYITGIACAYWQWKEPLISEDTVNNILGFLERLTYQSYEGTSPQINIVLLHKKSRKTTSTLDLEVGVGLLHSKK